jgi:hypothetical protein
MIWHARAGRRTDAWYARTDASASSIRINRVVIPGISDVIPTDKTDEDREAREEIINLNDQGYSELITMIDTPKSGGKVAFAIVKRSKTTEF